MMSDFTPEAERDLINSFIDKGSPTDLNGLVKAFGVQLDDQAVLPDDVLGQIVWNNDDQFYQISVRADQPEFRKRFTIAHEFGHFIMHRSLLLSGVDDNRMFRKTRRMGLNFIDDRNERQANKFAANLLLPNKHVYAYVTQNKLDLLEIKPDDISKMADFFIVSKISLAIRLEQMSKNSDVMLTLKPAVNQTILGPSKNYAD